MRMRKLLLQRHAKSSWADPELDDHARPLNARGIRDAPRVARAIAAAGLVPDAVLCSDAVRTRATLALMLSAWPDAKPAITFDPALYLGEPAAILEAIGRVPASAATVMVIGHNPGLHALALSLTGAGERRQVAELAARFPTCALAAFEFDREGWQRLQPASGRLIHLVFPKLLG